MSGWSKILQFLEWKKMRLRISSLTVSWATSLRGRSSTPRNKSTTLRCRRPNSCSPRGWQ
jgi:hypothetical protein